MMAGIHERERTQKRKPNRKKMSADRFGDDSRATTSIGTSATRMASVSECGG